MDEQWTFYFSYILLFKVLKKKKLYIKYEIKINKSSQHVFIGKIPNTQNEVGTKRCEHKLPCPRVW